MVFSWLFPLQIFGYSPVVGINSPSGHFFVIQNMLIRTLVNLFTFNLDFMLLSIYLEYDLKKKKRLVLPILKESQWVVKHWESFCSSYSFFSYRDLWDCIGLEDNCIVSKVIWFRMLHVFTMEMKWTYNRTHNKIFLY